MRPPPPGLVIAVGAWLAAGAGLLLAGLLAAGADKVVLVLASQAAVALPVLLLLIPLRPRHLGMGPASLRALGNGAGLGPVAFACSLACFWLLAQLVPPPQDPPVEQAIREIATRLGQGGLLLIAAVLPGVLEEALFRGVILTGLRRHCSDWAAILLCALLFAALHLDPWRFLPQLSLGILCGWLAVRCGSCWPAAMLHAVHNACVLVVASAALAPPST